MGWGYMVRPGLNTQSQTQTYTYAHRELNKGSSRSGRESKQSAVQGRDDHSVKAHGLYRRESTWGTQLLFRASFIGFERS